MSKGQTIILIGDSQRTFAKELIDKAPVNAVVNIRAPSRTISQNDKMWPMLSDISRAKPEGRMMAPELWKSAFMNALKHEVLFMQGLDGGAPFPVGFKTSKLSVPQMRELIEYIYWYGAQHNVVWSEPDDDYTLKQKG